MGKILLRCVFGLSLVLLPLAMFGQSGSDMGQSGPSMNGQVMSATGCLQKGQENGGYYLTDENGKTWELAGQQPGGTRWTQGHGQRYPDAGFEVTRDQSRVGRESGSRRQPIFRP